MRHLLAAAGLAFIAFTANIASAADRWTELPEPPAMPKPEVSGTAPVNGINMYYAVYGTAEGTPILMIHGGLGHGDIWSNQVLDLAKDHKVIIADSRGHGRTTRDAQAYSYDLMASDYLGLLDFLKVDKVDLVGWSDGGIIGLDIAMTHPERLNKLFAQAANTDINGVNPKVLENATFLAYIDRMGVAYKAMSPTPDQFDAFVGQISEMWASQPNWTAEQLAKITTPTAIVIGDYDEAILPEHTAKMAKEVPGAKLITLKDTSHFAMLQDPAGYNAAIRNFLGEE